MSLAFLVVATTNNGPVTDRCNSRILCQKRLLDKTDAERYFKGFVVACRENGKETAIRLIKHFSSECVDDWEKESGLVNALGETEHPNILTYCWHCKSMY